MLSVTQAAKLLNLSRPSVYALCQNQRITHYRLGGGADGGGIRITTGDLLAYALSRRKAVRPPPPAEAATVRTRKRQNNPLGLVHLPLPKAMRHGSN
jgi:excisionase family DNA binding protein